MRPLLESPSRLALGILSEEDVAAVHEAALRLLATDAAGAAERALAQAPSSIVLAGRVPERDIALDGEHSWLGLGGPAAEVRPMGGGESRPGTASDLTDACRLADALDELALVVGPPLRTSDLTPLGELACCLQATSKHILAPNLLSPPEAEAAILMARAVVPHPDDLAQRPPLSIYADSGGVGAALAFARAGLPVAVSLDTVGNPAGDGLYEALVGHHAAVLSACAAVQSEVPGARFMYPALCPRHGQARHPAERDILMISSLQLAAHARLPAVAAAFGTGDDQPAWQACTDGAFGALSAVAVSGSLLTGAGSLAGGRIFSPEQLVMDSEVFSWAARIGAGIRVDEEAIGLEVIKNVGIGGNFLGQRHTRRHMKDVWRPRLLDRSMWDAWMASGREGPYEKATGLCDTLLREHEVAPIEADAAGQLAKIVAGAGL